jgi:hypothetical protein
LKIVGLLANQPADLAGISQALPLPSREGFNHLAFLQHVGVVRANAGQYELDTDGLEKIARRQFEGQRESYQPEEGLDQNTHKTLATFLNADGSIQQMPNSRTQAVKFRIILEYVLAAFEPGASYTEKEVNGLLLRFNADVAGLRRDLIDMGMLKRERDGSRYWRPE